MEKSMISEHYEEIYCKLLGYSKATLKEWKQKRII